MSGSKGAWQSRATPELVYGLSVTGLVHPGRVLRNGGARPGDLLVFTKPLGLGFLATAVKAGLADPTHAGAMAETMAALNRGPAERLAEHGARAATDVTGCGFAGHALAIARESGVELALRWDSVPVLPGAREALGLGLVPAGAYRKRDAYAGLLRVRAADADAATVTLCDPQTSGGLLVALPADRAEGFARRAREAGAEATAMAGEVRSGRPGLVVE